MNDWWNTHLMWGEHRAAKVALLNCGHAQHLHAHAKGEPCTTQCSIKA